MLTTMMVTIPLDEYRALIEKVTRYELLEELERQKEEETMRLLEKYKEEGQC